MSATCQLYLLALASALAMHLSIHFLLLIQIHSCREVGVDPSCQRVRSKPCTDYQGDKQSFMLIYTYTLESLINLTSISLYCGTECTQTWEGTCKLYSERPQLTGGFQPRIFLLWGNIASLHAALCPNHSVIFASKNNAASNLWMLRPQNVKSRTKVQWHSSMFIFYVQSMCERCNAAGTCFVSSNSLCFLSFIVSVHESLHAGTVDRGLSSVIWFAFSGCVIIHNIWCPQKHIRPPCFGAEWRWPQPPRHHLCTQIVKCKLICKKMPH